MNETPNLEKFIERVEQARNELNGFKTSPPCDLPEEATVASIFDKMNSISQKPDASPKSVFDMIMEEIDNPAAFSHIRKEYHDLVSTFELQLREKAEHTVKMLRTIELKNDICYMLDEEINRLTEESKRIDVASQKTAMELQTMFKQHGNSIHDESKGVQNGRAMQKG